MTETPSTDTSLKVVAWICGGLTVLIIVALLSAAINRHVASVNAVTAPAAVYR